MMSLLLVWSVFLCKLFFSRVGQIDRLQFSATTCITDLSVRFDDVSKESFSIHVLLLIFINEQ